MEAIRETTILPRPPETGRWAICIAVALGIHTAAAAALVARWHAESDQVANAPLIMVELQPLAVAPNTKATEAPPGPPQQQAAVEPEPPKPLEKAVERPPQPQHTEAPPQHAPQEPVEHTAALAPEPKAELQFAAAPSLKLPEKTVEKPVEKRVEKIAEKKRQQKHASLASAPSAANKKAERAAAPVRGAASLNSNAVPNWHSALVAQIERHKRYPDGTRDHGIALVSFSIDRRGGVHDARIVHSSESSVLDRDALAWVQRSQPLPPPPPEIAGAQIAITVPLRYKAQ